MAAATMAEAPGPAGAGDEDEDEDDVARLFVLLVVLVPSETEFNRENHEENAAVKGHMIPMMSWPELYRLTSAGVRCCNLDLTSFLIECGRGFRAQE